MMEAIAYKLHPHIRDETSVHVWLFLHTLPYQPFYGVYGVSVVFRCASVSHKFGFNATLMYVCRVEVKSTKLGTTFYGADINDKSGKILQSIS
jgi:hypothetical protein